jgi:hypothetical protein
MAHDNENDESCKFKLGDLVHYHETYIIPPDAVNWKLTPSDRVASDSLCIIVNEEPVQWDMRPHGKYKFFMVMHVKSGQRRTCSSHNLTKAYFYDEIEKKQD